MAEADLEAGLSSLRESLRQIKALLAWQELKNSEEEPDQPPAFRLSESTESDLRNEYSFFLFTSLQMHTAINDDTSSIPEARREQIKHQLIKLESQLYSLGLQERFR